MKHRAQREEALFQAAAQLAGTARASFLDNACLGDAVLRQRLESLLAAHEETEGPLAEPATAAEATLKVEFADGPDESIGERIGRYKILEKVGEGGCGVGSAMAGGSDTWEFPVGRSVGGLLAR